MPAPEYASATAGLSKRRFALAASALVVALAAGLGVWLAGRGDRVESASGDPIVFLRGVVRQIAVNDYGGVWLKLHPAQQRVATRQAYIRCEQLSPIPGHLDWIRLVRAAHERIAVAGGDGSVDSRVATFRVRLSEPVLREVVVVPMTVHAVPVDGRWRWILSPKRFELYRSKSCLG